MSGLAASALHHRDRIWPAVLVSLAVHGVLLGVAAVGRRGPALDLDQKPITARLVRLGEPRPKELLPRKEAPPPEPAPKVEAPPAPVAAPPAAAPAPTVAPVAKAVATPRAEARPAAERSAPARGTNRLASVVSQMKEELQAGSPDGDPLGDAEVGEGDPYTTQVASLLRQNYRLPSTISDRERLRLTGTVILFIEPDGRIGRFEWAKHSDNPAFDEALERAVRQTTRLPPPPPDRRDAYRRSGLPVGFKI